MLEEQVPEAKVLEKPIVKLLTFWMRDKDWELTPCSSLISHGVWQTCAVEIIEGKRAYTFKCAWPMHNDLKVGDKRRMWESVTLYLCHQVELKHFEKIPITI
ncbi:MAG: hypothetical protein V4547_17595 [Bacteroidota bacterium]